jgi:hypothetical protein
MMGGTCSKYGERRVAYKALVGESEGKSHLEYTGVDEKIIFRCIFRKFDVGVWTGTRWLRNRRGREYF